MEVVIKGLQFIHVIAGFTSLILFWIPIISRKGNVNHIKVGKMYVLSMWIVVISAIILSVKNLIIGNFIGAAFLGFLALITANPLWHGIAILKMKKGVTKEFNKKLLAFKSVILLCGIGLIIYGVAILNSNVSILMFVFGGLSLTEIPPIYRLMNQTVLVSNILKEHLIAMCTSGIAAYTAFLVFGANQIFNYQLPGYWAVIPWIAPSIVGAFGIFLGVKYFTKNGLILRSE